MVLIHELGHYTTAKILGFTVEEFSVGFGPRIFGKRRKNGEMFSLRVLPLGGFCSFYGDAEDEPTAPQAATVSADNAKDNAQPANTEEALNSASAENAGGAVDSISDPTADNGNDKQGEKEDLLSYVMRSKIDEQAPAVEAAPKRLDKNGQPALTFFRQKPWKRIIVLFCGVLFNFISAIVFSFIYIWAVGYAVPMVHDSYTDADVFKKGDIILAVDGHEFNVMKGYSDFAADFKEGQTVTFKIKRDGKIISVDATKKQITYTDEDGEEVSYVGFGFVSQTAFVGNDIGTAFKYCVPYTFKLSWAILGSFGELISGKVPITSVSGPIGSIKLMADVTSANWRNILILLPLLASNLAMFNILPIPALDGAQIIFTIIEWIRKKPIKRKVQGMINAIGLGVLLLFVAIVDILSFAL